MRIRRFAAITVVSLAGLAPAAGCSPPVPAPIALGVYQPQQDMSGRAIDRYIREVGGTPALAWLPMTWEHLDGSFWPFDPQMLDEFRARGIMPGLTWEPSKGRAQTVGPNQPDFSWKQILSGRYDQYVSQFARDAAAYGHPFVLRVLHEMNGTWYPWGYSVNGNTNVADLVGAYQHIVGIFRTAGATNVEFVWNPSVMNAATIAKFGPLLKEAYPGDAYVDWVALDGYNNAVDNWRSLADVFAASYQFVTGISSRPMILFEVGSIENASDLTAKASWITQGFLTTIPNQFPRVRVAVWFNAKDGSNRDFSVETSPNALDAWRQVVSSPLYQGHVP